MGSIDYEKMNQRKNERFVLLFFSIYSVCMILLSITSGWQTWVTVLLFADVVIAWILHLQQWRDYRSRGILTIIVMGVSILLYGTNVKDLYPVLAVLAVFVVLAGMYGILDLFYDTFVASAFLIIYHAFFLHSIHFTSVGDTIMVLMQIANIFVEQFVVISWIKQRNESSRQVSESIRELEKAQRTKDDFLANVSHEIRTPINTICGMSEILQDEEDPQKIREQVRIIQNAGRNLMSLVSDILDFSELQAGTVELEEEAYNITSMINDLIQTAVAKKNNKPLELIVNCDPNLPASLYGDEKKIRRVISNILDNAIKFTDEGFVSIGISGRRESYGINLCVTVRDTGIGIEEENLEKLFTSFAQVDTRRSREEGGMGLGLAISKAIVRKMGGTITIKSKYGRGTAVRIVIPQKILNEAPIADIADRDQLNVAVYIDMEQFERVEIRDEYTENISRMAEQLRARCRLCRNLGELKRRQEREAFTHIFISAVEYQSDRAYFDGLARRSNVIVVIDPWQEKDVPNPDIKRIYKPFYILPVVSALNDAEDKERPGHSRMGGFTAPTAHVLVVDDNEMNINVITELLKKYRIRTTAAKSGSEALEKIETMDYDFIFMDHMMPEMDGVETLHHIREKGGSYYRKVPVIMLTANAIAGMRARFLKEGFADFLEKPVEVSVLERILRRTLPAEKILLTEEEQTSAGTNRLPEQREQPTPVNGQEKYPAPAGTDRLPEQERQLTDVSEQEKHPAPAEPEQGIPGIDIETGLLYCGGEEGYRAILANYCERGDSHLDELQTLYRNEAWDEYTIAVHGIKSAMMSIGAVHVSGLAKALEAAGKAGDLQYIREHHGELADEYSRVLANIRKSGWVDAGQLEIGAQTTTAASKEPQELREIGAEELRGRIGQLEDAMYALEMEEMLKILDELEEYSYHGKAFGDLLAPVRRKITMCDYMSAVDLLKQSCMRIEAGGKEGEHAGEIV